MSRIERAVIVGLLATVRLGAAAEFEVNSAAPLSVAWRGAPLIVAERTSPDFPSEATVTGVDVAGWDAVYHVWRADEKSKTRVEAAVSREAIELTLVRLVAPDVVGAAIYAFTVPHGFLDGRKVELIAEPQSAKEAAARKGLTVGTLGPNDIKSAKLLSYLRVHHSSGSLDIDFNPRGWWTSEKTMTPHAAEWNMRRTKEGYEFTTAVSRAQAGTLQEFKVVIRRADQRPVVEVHPRAATRWTDGYRNVVQVTIGPTRIKRFANLAGQPDANAPARWLDPAAVRIERDDRFAKLAPVRLEGASPIDPKSGATLELRVPRDGYYLVNLLVGAADRTVGPCDLTGGDGKSRLMPAVAAGDYDTWAIVGSAVAGRISLRFRGDFRLAAVGVTPMLYENEDFLFRRDWWISPQRHPDDTLPK